MAFFNEFPNTRTYDSDLGWLIQSVGTLIEKMESLDIRDGIQREEIDKLKNDMAAIIDAIREPITDWNGAIAYPIYSMVRYNGTLYSAIQDVPGGISILDTDYWIESNGLTTLIGQLQTDVINLNTKLQELAERPSGKLIALGYGTPIDPVPDHKQNAFNVIKTETGKTIFVDFGWKYSQGEVASMLAAHGITTLDALIITHYHADHIGNLENVLDSVQLADEPIAYIPPEPLSGWDDAVMYQTRYTNINTLLTSRGFTIVNPTDTTYTLDDATELEFFNTGNESYYMALGTAKANYNNNSYCCYVKTGGNVIMITGDIETDAIDKLAPDVKHVNLMQFPHHGYGRKYTPDFFNNILPDAVFINNADGDDGSDSPIPRTGNQLYLTTRKYGKPIYCTSDGYGTYDFEITLNDKMCADVKSNTMHDDGYGRNMYGSITANAGKSYYDVAGLTYNEILETLDRTSRTIFLFSTTANFAPINHAYVEYTKTNDGSYDNSFENNFCVVNRFTKYDGKAKGEITTYYAQATDDYTTNLQNMQIGNAYRLNCGTINQGQTVTKPTLSINHGDDITVNENDITLNKPVKLLMIHFKFRSASTTPTGYFRITIGTKNTDLYVYNERADIVTFNTDIPAGAITVTNNTDANTNGQVFIQLLPIAYEAVNI